MQYPPVDPIQWHTLLRTVSKLCLGKFKRPIAQEDLGLGGRVGGPRGAVAQCPGNESAGRFKLWKYPDTPHSNLHDFCCHEAMQLASGMHAVTTVDRIHWQSFALRCVPKLCRGRGRRATVSSDCKRIFGLGLELGIQGSRPRAIVCDTSHKKSRKLLGLARSARSTSLESRPCFPCPRPTAPVSASLLATASVPHTVLVAGATTEHMVFS